MADENKPAFYPRVGNIKAKNFKSAKPAPFIDDERAMDLPQFGDLDLSKPTKVNLEMSRRIAERDAALKRQQDADTSPLEKLAGGLQAGRFMGSALTQAINSMPTRIAKGDEAAEKFMQERMYKPTQPKAYEYAGDVADFLEQLETQYKIPPVLPEAIALQYLSGPAASQATKAAGKGAQKLEKRLDPIVTQALERGGLQRDLLMGLAQGAQSNVVKPKGGNWMGGNVEQALKRLKAPTAPRYTHINERGQAVGEGYGRPMTAEELQQLNADPIYVRNEALNKWIDSNLNNYVKKQMATPEDPVRNLAEEGITHFPIAEDPTYWARKGESSRKEAGGVQMALSDLAKQWENRSDAAINAETAQQHQDMMHLAPGLYSNADDWIKKLPPDTKLYNTRGANLNPSDLGFDHIIDVLSEDLAAGRIRPEQLNKVSMEQAVRRTYEYDQELAAKMSAARASAREGLPVFKEYPEGYRWVELNKPGSFASESEAMGHSVRGYEPPKGHPDWTEGSGDSGHLGYGYGGWEGIKSGRAKVYSLVDSKGQPHVTIETKAPDLRSNYDELQPLQRQADLEADAQNFQTFAERDKFADKRYQELKAQLMAQKKPEGDYRITQIKGKSNAAPKEDYLPYVQDFVKGGNWSTVGDISNTGLRDVNDWINPDTQKAYEQYKLNVPRFATDEELDRLHNEYLRMAEPQNYKPPEGMKRGGKVSISSNPDTMMLELSDRKMAPGGLVKGLVKAAKEATEAERALPLRLPRALPKPLSEINAHAERVARQMMGEHVTSGKPGDTKNLAGRSKKESQRVKELQYELVPTKSVPESQVVESKLGDINVALPGDFTVSDVELKRLMGEHIGSRQEGGSRYGLGHLEDEIPLFYASNEGPAQQVQNKVTDLYNLYGPERVMGHHMAMGPIATNFAQHFADANLRYIDYSKLRPQDMYQFDKIVSEGFALPKKNKKTGETTYKIVDFPDWPGLADPQAAYEAMKANPEMRKWFNKLMQTPSITEPLNLPNAQDVRYAITSPDLRDMEVNLTGHGVGRMVPGGTLTDTADHNTYAKGIRGIYEGHQDVLTPFPISFADAAQHIMSTQRPQDFTGTIQKVFPHQLVDQQYLDELGAYRKRLKELTGKKAGGAVKQPAAYIDGSEFVEAAKKHGIKDSMNNLNKIVDLVNKGLSVDDAARQVADGGMHKAAGGAISGDDLILEERPL